MDNFWYFSFKMAPRNDPSVFFVIFPSRNQIFTKAEAGCDCIIFLIIMMNFPFSWINLPQFFPCFWCEELNGVKAAGARILIHPFEDLPVKLVSIGIMGVFPWR